MPSTEVEAHRVAVALEWGGGYAGTGRLSAQGLPPGTAVAAPAALGGPGAGASPEALLLASAASCYAVTLAGILERMRLPVSGLTVRSEADVETGPPIRLARLVHRPLIRLGAPGAAARARRAALLAEEHCMVSRALRGNVDMRVEPEVREEP